MLLLAAFVYSLTGVATILPAVVITALLPSLILNPVTEIPLEPEEAITENLRFT